ncbi:hypothetical protein AGMMS50267_13660 [Spirochaetia bacterium]|nr:hypothetical protein AGMMS50267_13660 [Spirochaetia bacterium]
MKKNRKGSGAFKSLLMVGMVAAVLAFGLVLAGCDNGGGGDDGGGFSIKDVNGGDLKIGDTVELVGIDISLNMHYFVEWWFSDTATPPGDGDPVDGANQFRVTLDSSATFTLDATFIPYIGKYIYAYDNYTGKTSNVLGPIKAAGN